MSSLLFRSLLFSLLACAGTMVPAAASWTTLATTGLPTARHECAFAELNGRFYLLGGRRINPVDVFDPATLSWSALSSSPIELHHFQAVTHGGLIYLVGAMSGSWPGEPPIQSVLIYSPAEDRWIEGPEFPLARRRGGAGSVVFEDEIWVIGGQLEGHESGTNGWVDRFDPRSGQWTVVPADMPHARDHLQAVVLGGKIYAAAGRVSAFPDNWDGTVAPVDMLNLNTLVWMTLPGTLPTERAGAPAAVLGGEILVMGGESDSQIAAHSESEIHDPMLGSWVAGLPMQRGRHGTQAITYENQIYVAAGSGNRGGNPELDSIECYSAGGSCATPAAVVHQNLVGPASLDFGSFPATRATSQIIQVTHPGSVGDADLVVERLETVGRDMDAFAAFYRGGELPLILAPGESMDIEVNFMPDAEVAYGVGIGSLGSLSAAALVVEYQGGASSFTMPLLGSGGPTATGVDGDGLRPALASLRARASGEMVAFEFSLPHAGRAALGVFNLRGERIARFDLGWNETGPQQQSWRARDDRGRRLPRGSYLLRLTSGGMAVTSRVLILP